MRATRGVARRLLIPLRRKPDGPGLFDRRAHEFADGFENTDDGFVVRGHFAL